MQLQVFLACAICLKVSVAQSCLTLCDSMEQPGSSVLGFPRQEHWSGLPCPSPGDLPNPGTEPGSPALQAESLPSEPAGKPKICLRQLHFIDFCSSGTINCAFNFICPCLRIRCRHQSRLDHIKRKHSTAQNTGDLTEGIVYTAKPVLRS